MMTSFYRESLVGLPAMAVAMREVWESSGPARRRAGRRAYDHFTPFVLASSMRLLRRGESLTSSRTDTSTAAGGSRQHPTR
jgi:hypothetical protein